MPAARYARPQHAEGGVFLDRLTARSRGARRYRALCIYVCKYILSYGAETNVFASLRIYVCIYVCCVVYNTYPYALKMMVLLFLHTEIKCYYLKSSVCMYVCRYIGSTTSSRNAELAKLLLIPGLFYINIHLIYGHFCGSLWRVHKETGSYCR